MHITEIEIARAVIAHEAVDCFIGKEAAAAKQPKKLVSCTGGVFWGKSGETWPRTADGRPLIPWLQIVCSEMKGLYGPFYRREAVCFYIDEDFSDATAQSKFDGHEFVVREYRLGEKLVPLTRPKELKGHAFHAVTWKKQPDYPALSKYYKLFENSVYKTLCDDKKLKYVNRSGLKIGGWPTPVQTGQKYPGTYDLQIDMTKNYMYHDSGVGHLSACGGIWNVEFESC